jgi:hypothetical protein
LCLARQKKFGVRSGNLTFLNFLVCIEFLPCRFAGPDPAITLTPPLRVAQHRVDFVICDRACNVTAVVELDDRTHHAGKDQRRDKRLNQGAIRTVRFQSKNKPDVRAIREAVLGLAGTAVATPAVVAAPVAASIAQ